MTEKAKQKQVVVNVTEASKAKIIELKKQYNVSDKEFVAAVLVVLDQTAEDVIKSAVEKVTIEKQKAKIEAKIAKVQAQIEAIKTESPELEGEPETSETPEG